MNTPTLFDATLDDLLASHPGAAHRNDRVTAQEAARRVGPRIGKQKAAVLLALADAGDDGLTGHQACDLTPCAYPHVATTRIEELVRLGAAEPTDRTRRTPSGHQATVWQITERGRWLADELSRAEETQR